MTYPPVLVLTGPTAVGKTALSLPVAERLGGEVISCDARQIYRQLTIGTAKPDPADLARIPHHFIDERDLEEPYSAGMYEREALRRIAEVFSRGRIPIVVGGSTLYLHALLHGLDPLPPAQPELRRWLTERARREGWAALYAELEHLDPQMAQTLDPTKTQRLLRALEVYYATGKPISSFFGQRKTRPFRFAPLVLIRDRRHLYRRIDDRVLSMIERGLVEEVRALWEQGYSPELNALRTTGYMELFPYLRGEYDLERAIYLIQRNTRHYAKRQHTWFRRDPALRTWIDLDQLEGSGQDPADWVCRWWEQALAHAEL
jgi:tRNA dimethylallyltransferase|nr:MAG: tRNA dimethylallyltransferase [Bacteroidota bacterium]